MAHHLRYLDVEVDASPGEGRATDAVKRCAVLYVDKSGKPSRHVQLLSDLGFAVREAHAWPERDDEVMENQVIVVRLEDIEEAPLVAMRIRTKPHFGQRVLIALVPPETPMSLRRMAEAAGFDHVTCERTEPRLFVARLMRTLRQRPEYRCYLPRKNAA